MKKSFSIDIILSITTGVLLKEGGFNDMHALAEHVVGHPVWTHEFGEKALWDRMRELVFAQHPQLREAEPFRRPSAEQAALRKYLTAYVERAVAKFGASLEVESGVEERTENPLESLQRMAPEKPIVVIAVDDK